MVKKTTTHADEDETLLASAVRSSAHQIWQAGLGAFAKAQEEGGRVFNRLVKEGTDLQKRARSAADDKLAEATDTIGAAAGGVGKQATGSWDKLEQVFEERVARALAAIGVPTQKDIHALVRKVEQLSDAVAALSVQQPAAARPATARPATAKRAAEKPAAVKKAAASKPAAKAGAARPAARAAARKPPAAKPPAAKPAAAKPAAARPAAKAAPNKAAAAKPAARKAKAAAAGSKGS